MKTNLILLGQLPKGATKVRVVDEFGRQRWKLPGEVTDTDILALDSKGLPVTMDPKPGRKKSESSDVVSQAPFDHVADQKKQEKEDALRSDPVLSQLQKDGESSDVLASLMEAMAVEAASLAFERSEAERYGDSVSMISARRINALKAIGETWLRRKDQIVSKGVDLDSVSFRVVLSCIADAFKKSMEQSNLRSEQIEAVFTKFAKELSSDGWRAEVESRLGGRR